DEGEAGRARVGERRRSAGDDGGEVADEQQEAPPRRRLIDVAEPVARAHLEGVPARLEAGEEVAREAGGEVVLIQPALEGAGRLVAGEAERGGGIEGLPRRSGGDEGVERYQIDDPVEGRR